MDVRGEPSGRLFALYFSFKVLPILVGASSIYLGYRLFVLGVTGQASLSLQSTTVSGQLLNAAPGLFFAIGGIVIVIGSIVKGVDIVQHPAVAQFGALPVVPSSVVPSVVASSDRREIVPRETYGGGFSVHGGPSGEAVKLPSPPRE